MLPLAGGVSLYFAAANPFTSDVFESLAPRRGRFDGKAVRAVPMVAAAVRNRRLFIVLFLVDEVFGDMFDWFTIEMIFGESVRSARRSLSSPQDQSVRSAIGRIRCGKLADRAKAG